MQDNCYSLTYPQKNIWLVEKYNGNNQINSVIGTIEIKNKFSEKKCREALEYIVKKNDVLRLKIEEKDGKIYQIFEDEKDVNVTVINMEKFSDEEKNNWITENAKIPLDISNNKLYEFYLFNYGNNCGAMYIKMHHIICDAWSGGKLVTQIIKYLENEIDVDEEKIYSYKEYIQSEEEYTASEKFVKDEEFWKEYLKEIKEPISLKEKGTNNKEASRYHIVLSSDKTQKINDFCKENKISQYVLFMTALSIYIYRTKNSNDFVIGTPVLNRTNFKEKNIIGMFVSTLPFRVKIDENEKFIDLAKKISLNTLTVFRHQKYPYSKTVEYIHENTNVKENLYNIVLSYQNARADVLDEEVYSTTWPFSGVLNNELQIHITDLDDTGCLNINYDYMSDIFDLTEIKYIHSRIMSIIEDAIEKEYVSVETIRIMSKEEERKILYEFNDTKTDYPKDKTVIEIFEEQVEKDPNGIAIVDGNVEITYKELNEKANLIANKVYNYLDKSISNNIGVIISKKMESIEMILAILKLGYTFVPIDIGYPFERINKIIKIADISVCLVDKEYKNKINIDTVNFIDNEIITKEGGVNYSRIKNDNLYVIFTSGSTGNPKGVIIKNQNFVNLLYAQLDRKLEFENKKILQFATMSFDVSYQEIFSSICFGGKLVLLSDVIKKDSVKLCEYICKNSIEMLFIPPAYLRIICEIDSNREKIRNTVKDIIVAGEQLIINDNIKELLANTKIKIHNHYGPAETHVVTTVCYDYDNIINIDKISIGKPINNTKIFILDEKERILPIGIQGEIVVTGNAVGNGYVNNIDMTNKVFKKINNKLCYKTGDIGYNSFSGNIYFEGRRDFQIKHNGYRIEIEEVEKNLLKLPYVINSVLKVVNKDDKKEIIAVLELGKKVKLNELKNDLLKLIPKYMLPNKYYIIEKMPINRNGKIDRKTIDIDTLELLKNDEIDDIIKDNENKIIVECIENLLDIEINSNIDIFEYGMDSLQVIKLQAELMKHEIMVSVQDIYDNPTISELIEFIKNGKKKQNLEHEISIRTVNQLKIINRKIKNILITGVTGYLGIHVLKSILDKDREVKIISLTRRYINLSPEERLKERIRYYYGEEYISYFVERVSVLESNLDEQNFGLEKNIYDRLKNEVDVVINCAALVSHYASKEMAENSNCNSIKNLIEFCKNSDIVLNHISTIGVSGNGLVENDKCTKDFFDENDLYIGQEYENNIYVYTKALGENIVYQNMDNVKANIIRIGNLTNRYSDCKFQRNYSKNAFQMKLKEFMELGIIPEEILNYGYDMTPVDICSNNIVNVLFSNRYNEVYHIYNDNVLKFYDILNIMENTTNKKIKIVSMKEFVKILLQKNKDDKNYTLLQDIMIKNTNCLKVVNSITRSRGFSNFDNINNDYYYKVIKEIWRNINEN